VGANFRRNLIHESGLSQYARNDPSEVKPEARSERWAAVADAAERFDSLSMRERLWVTQVLLYLGLHAWIVRRVPRPAPAELAGSADATLMAWLRVFAQTHLPSGATPGVRDELEAIVKHGARMTRGWYRGVSGLLIYHSKFARDAARARELYQLSL